MGEIAWHGHYIKYFELARCELLELVNYSYQDMADSGYFWPIINLQVKYLRPAIFDQSIKVTATLEEWEYRLRIRYEITSELGAVLTSGLTDQVPLERASNEMALGVPEVIMQRIQRAVDAW